MGRLGCVLVLCLGSISCLMDPDPIFGETSRTTRLGRYPEILYVIFQSPTRLNVERATLLPSDLTDKKCGSRLFCRRGLASCLLDKRATVRE